MALDPKNNLAKFKLATMLAAVNEPHVRVRVAQ